MINQIKILPIRERVAAEFRKAILTGVFAAGEELTQDKLAGMLGVSRMPVREAIQILANEGLIKIFPNRSAVVREIPKDFIKEHFEARILLEGEAAARACTRFESLDDILSIHKEYREAIDTHNIDQVHLLNQSFHITIWDVSENMKIRSFILQLWNGLSIITVTKSLKNTYQEHEAIIQAFREKDPEKARQAMKKHLENSMQNILLSQKINIHEK